MRARGHATSTTSLRAILSSAADKTRQSTHARRPGAAVSRRARQWVRSPPADRAAGAAVSRRAKNVASTSTIRDILDGDFRKVDAPEPRGTAEVGDVWQSHRTLTDDADHNTDEALIANLTEEDDCRGHWIKAMVAPDGRSWSMTNGRTGYSRTYRSR